ncbi:MAG: DUF4835 family protein [Lentimicrobiaceae bacterium]|jgi:hypothetical protein|nr:DUF4835 family protein [Lentimicrobiaceae bacterium]
MKKWIAIISLIFSFTPAYTQELNATVQVSAQQVEGTERKVFQTLQQALYEFINNKQWSNYSYKLEERIECTFLITITERLSSDEFKAKLNIVVRRPIFKTSYNSTLFNYIDNDFTFRYIEYQPLDYDENAFTSNLTSVIAFYVNIVLGLDADSFTAFGGSPYFEKAQTIISTAQNATEKGWKAFESQKNRYWLIENLLNSSYSPIREAMYKYHRLGMDVFTENIESGRASVTESLELLRKVNRQKPGLFLIQLVMDAKRDELVNIYSQAAPMDKTKAVNLLKEIDPANSSKYQKILTDK